MRGPRGGEDRLCFLEKYDESSFSEGAVMKPPSKNSFDGNLVHGGKNFHIATKRASLISEPMPESWKLDFFRQEKVESSSPRPEKFESIEVCLLCGCPEMYNLIKNEYFAVSRCSKCSFGFQNPRLKAETVPELYTGKYPMEDVYDSDISVDLDYKKFVYGAQLAASLGASTKSVLDVGCGSGLSLRAYRDQGFSYVAGVDPAPYDFPEDLVVFPSFLDELPSDLGGFSLISLWDTLEHIWDFRRLLRSTAKALDEDGLVLICVPNVDSLATRLIREKSPTFCLDHLNYFSAESLKVLFEQCGLKIVHLETIISEVDNCRNYLEFSEPYLSKPKGEGAFEWLTPDYIHDNLMGSRLLALGARV